MTNQGRRALSKHLQTVIAHAVLAASVWLSVSAIGQTLNVTSYNWLQLPPLKGVDPLTEVAGGAPGGGNGYGNPSDYRWGHHVWIPDSNMTTTVGGALTDYWAYVKLDQSRNVKTVRVQWWYQEGTGIRKYYLQGSNDGSSWTDIGSFDYGSMWVSGARDYRDVSVTSGSYRYIRVYLKANDATIGGPDFQYGSPGRGGPGLYAVEPMGDGSVPYNMVNWANQGNFGTTTSNRFTQTTTFTGTRYNDGWLFDDEGVRTGETNTWSSGDFVQIDLKRVRAINHVIVVWDYGWWSASYNIQYSTDNTTYTPVPNKSSPNDIDNSAATEYTFDSVFARYVRISDAAGPAYWGLLNQVLVYGPRAGGTVILVL